ncbi:MAG: Acetylornithine deacetylase, partial [uncultured Thermomicrobiales bacterium]
GRPVRRPLARRRRSGRGRGADRPPRRPPRLFGGGVRRPGRDCVLVGGTRVAGRVAAGRRCLRQRAGADRERTGADAAADRPRRHGAGGRGLDLRPLAGAAGGRPPLRARRLRYESRSRRRAAGDPGARPPPGGLARHGAVRLGGRRRGVLPRGQGLDRRRVARRRLRRRRIVVAALPGRRRQGADPGGRRRQGRPRLLAGGRGQRRGRSRPLRRRFGRPAAGYPSAHGGQPLRACPPRRRGPVRDDRAGAGAGAGQPDDGPRRDRGGHRGGAGRPRRVAELPGPVRVRPRAAFLPAVGDRPRPPVRGGVCPCLRGGDGRRTVLGLHRVRRCQPLRRRPRPADGPLRPPRRQLPPSRRVGRRADHRRHHPHPAPARARHPGPGAGIRFRRRSVRSYPL